MVQAKEGEQALRQNKKGYGTVEKDAEVGLEENAATDTRENCGGDCVTTVFLFFFEAFTAVWISSALWVSLKVGLPGLLFVGFGFLFHWCTQSSIRSADPGKVHQTLQSLEEEVDDDATKRILQELSLAAPRITFNYEAYYTTTSPVGENTRTETHVAHTETAEFEYSSWRDISAQLPALENYDIVAVRIVPEFKCADSATVNAETNLRQQLHNICLKHRHQVRHSDHVLVNHKIMSGSTSRILVSRTPGKKASAWMTDAFYTRCCFAFPFVGTIYRLMFFSCFLQIRHSVVKEVSISRKDGDNWKARV